MSKWQDVVDRLVRTVQIPLHTQQIPVETWPSEGKDNRLSRSFRDQHSVNFWLQTNAKTITSLQAPIEHMSEKEEQLILLLLDQAGVKIAGAKSTSAQMGQHLYDAIMTGDASEFDNHSITPKTGIAMLLWNRHETAANQDDIVRILNSFLSGNNYHFYPFPIDAGLLIMGNEEVEDTSETFAYAVQEVLLSESGMEVDVAVNTYQVDENSLVATTKELYETIQLGRKFQSNQYVHFPQTLLLEQIVNHIPAEFANKFVRQSLLQLADSEGEEIWRTIEAFFETNQNISETAKQLFIHRNTLLYRFERFKQITGYDVREFHDAIIVKLYLLLVKVTKATQ